MLRRLAPFNQRFGYKRTFTVLAFESSADDTCAAVVNSDRQILSNVVIKQTKELVYSYFILKSTQFDSGTDLKRMEGFTHGLQSKLTREAW